MRIGSSPELDRQCTVRAGSWMHEPARTVLEKLPASITPSPSMT
jgi:hypothetical protein